MTSRDLIRDYHVGGKDSRGRVIQVIFAHFDDYILYQANNLLEIQGNLEALNKSAEVQQRLNVLIPLTPNAKRARTSLQKSISAAIVSCMQADVPTAISLLDQMITRMTLRVVEVGRLLYLLGTISVAFAFSSLAGAVYFSSLPPRSTPVLLAYMAAFGGLGGIFSVATMLRQIQVDRDSGLWFNLGSGASRGLIAAIGGIFAYLAMKSGIFLSFLVEESDILGLLFGGFFAGFSESVVPNALRRTNNPGAPDDA